MDHFKSVDQNAFAAAFEDMRSLASDRRGLMHCPKPLRFGSLSENFHTSSCKLEAFDDSKARRDLLDLFLLKEDMEMEPAATPSSAAFFNGSPPSRVNNPLTQDPRFREERLNPIFNTYSPSSLLPSSPSSLSHKGCARVKFGLKPAAVRVEGFDCLSRDGQNSSIPAFA